jgi:hypothetical protein
MTEINNPDRQKNESRESAGESRPPGFLKPAIAACVIFALCAIIALLYFSYYKDEERKISYKCLYGDAFVNGVRFDDILLSPGDKIITKPESSSEIEIEKMFFINIYPDSEIEIEESYYSKKEKINVFNFKVVSGTIYARFEKASDLKYRFTTKNTKIESTGTEFLIEISKESTMLVVTEGSLSVTSLKTGETVTAREDKIYTVRDNIEVADVDKNEEVDDQLNRENLINKINEKKTGK